MNKIITSTLYIATKMHSRVATIQEYNDKMSLLEYKGIDKTSAKLA